MLHEQRSAPAVPDAVTVFRSRFQAVNRLWDAGAIDDAETGYRALLEFDPQSAALVCRLGDIAARRGDPAGAAERYRRAIELDASFPWSHVGLARLAERAGDEAAALAHYRAALAVAPDLDAVQGRVRELTARAAARDGAETFRARFEQANHLAESGQAEQAEAIYRALAAEAPPSAALLCKLGNVVAERGRAEEAYRCYERAIAADPAFPWPHVGRAELLEGERDYQGAVAALEAALARGAPVDIAENRIRALQRKAREQRLREAPVEIRRWPAAPGAAPAPEGAARIAVVAWDLAHNAAGRAVVLAEIAARLGPARIVGPLLPDHGDDLWAPLAEADRAVAVEGFHAVDVTRLLEGAIRLVREHPAEIAWVSKARLPGLLIGCLYKAIHGARLVVDLDDDELAFVGATAPLTVAEFVATAAPSDWTEPHGRRWTRLAQSMVAWADAVTVCNPVLQARHGGTLVRHARAAAPFDRARERRDATRAAFGFTPRDRVVLFLGTPRRHKGLLDLARALASIGDPDLVLCVIGSATDRGLVAELDALPGLRVAFHPDQPFSRVAELNAMADLVCVLQDPASPIARAQTPAKITDALASGTAVVATALEPIADLVVGGRILRADAERPVDAIRAALAVPPAQAGDDAAARRAFFRAELSTEAQLDRVRAAFAAARAAERPLPAEFDRLLAHLDAWLPERHRLPACPALAARLPLAPRPARRPGPGERLDLVFFWKQNDSDLFGRRQDMLLAELAASPRIRRILHVDAPISLDRLHLLSATEDGRAVAERTIARHLGSADDDKVHRRTFVYRGREQRLLGRELPYKDSYANVVEHWLRELDMLDAPVAWVCPVAPQFDEVHRRLRFPVVLADVIDDQRRWPMRPSFRAEIERGYREAFAVADVAVANCLPVADWLREEGLDPILVPNGLELHDDVERWPRPEAIARLAGPVVGYAGNLRDRIDWDLIGAVADRRPDWSIVLIGAVPDIAPARAVVGRANVHALGVLPYRRTLRCLAALDAAIIPHRADALSERMNPLKLYVYRGLGIPVVSTDIANIGDFRDEIRIATTPDGFVGALGAAIDERRRLGRRWPAPERLRALSWSSRLAAVMQRLDAVLAGASAGTGASPP